MTMFDNPLVAFLDPRGLLIAIREWESVFLSVASRLGLEWQEMDGGTRPWIWLDPERVTSVEEAIE